MTHPMGHIDAIYTLSMNWGEKLTFSDAIVAKN